MLGKLEYLLLQAYQLYLEIKMQLLDTIAKEFQKMNQGGKLAYIYSEWKLISLLKWVWFKLGHGCISRQQTDTYQLVNYKMLSRFRKVIQLIWKSSLFPKIHFLTLVHCRISCFNNALQFCITFLAKSSNELIWHIKLQMVLHSSDWIAHLTY